MKILHIIENLDNRYGGPARSVPLLIKYLNKLGIVNKIFTIQIYDNEINEILEKNDINVIKVPIEGIRKLRYSSRLETEIEKEITKDTIIHVHTVWTYPAYVGYKLSQKYSLPLVVSVRGTMYKWALEQSKYIKKIAMWLFQKEMLQKADIIHITEKNERTALEYIGIKNNCELIPNGIETNMKYDTLDQEILKKFNYNQNKRYLMFLGRIVHNKGLHYLIESFKNLKKSFTDVEVLVVGGMEDKKYFSTLERINGIHFLGMLEGKKKHTIFSISEIFISPSYSENFGMSIAEAMSYKLPVITTTGTPWSEVKEKGAGWWIKLNQKNLNKALEDSLHSSEKLLKYKGQIGFNIIKKYTWNKQALKMKKIYEETLSTKEIS